MGVNGDVADGEAGEGEHFREEGRHCEGGKTADLDRTSNRTRSRCRGGYLRFPSLCKQSGKTRHSCLSIRKRVVKLARTGAVGRWLFALLSLVVVMASAQGHLVVFDFDHTMIGCNSDTWVVEKLSKHKEQILGQLTRAGEKNAWTAGMDEAMAALHDEGVTVHDIRECMEAISIDQGIKDAIKRFSSRGSDVRVLSDANTLFIDWIIQANGLGDSVSKILSNPAHVQSNGQVRVRPFHTDPHHPSSSSPPNLCKGRVMDEWLDQGTWDKVVYCGDGGGDFEGCIRVPAGGVILARDGWTLHKKLLNATEAGNPPFATIQPWTDQQDLGRHLDALW